MHPTRAYARQPPRTARVRRETQQSRPCASSMRISQTWVLRPTWIGRAVPVTWPSVTARRWLALSSRPTACCFIGSSMHRLPATLARVSASNADDPPCNRPNGCLVRASTGMVPRMKSSPISVITMPSDSIAVPALSALICARLGRRRNGLLMPTVRSAHAQHARTPGRGVAAARVAGAVAVAGAGLAIAAAMHAVLQFLATRFQPIGAADAGRIHAAAGRFALAVFAEFVVGVDLVLEFLHADLNRDRVVEIAQHRNIVGDDVGRIGEIHQCLQHVLAI